MDDYKQVVTVRSGETKPCPVCGKGMGSATAHESDWLEAQANHLLEHGAKLLHIGQETSHDMDGAQWQHTVAAFGVPA